MVLLPVDSINAQTGRAPNAGDQVRTKFIVCIVLIGSASTEYQWLSLDDCSDVWRHWKTTCYIVPWWKESTVYFSLNRYFDYVFGNQSRQRQGIDSISSRISLPIVENIISVTTIVDFQLPNAAYRIHVDHCFAGVCTETESYLSSPVFWIADIACQCTIVFLMMQCIRDAGQLMKHFNRRTKGCPNCNILLLGIISRIFLLNLEFQFQY